MRAIINLVVTTGSLALLLCTGCVAEDQAPHFWRLSAKQGGAVLYVSEGRAFLVAHGHVYAYEPPEAQLERGAIELASTDIGVWRELHVPEVPLLDEVPESLPPPTP